MEQYNRFVKPSFDEYIYPTMKYADVIIPRGSENVVAINLVVKNIKRSLEEKGIAPFKASLAHLYHGKSDLPSNVLVLDGKNQLTAILTRLRDRQCPRDELIFDAHRVCGLLIERALSEFKFDPVKVETSYGGTFDGIQLNQKVSSGSLEICGVSIVRAGEIMEGILRNVCKDIKIGKILIQADKTTGDPYVHVISNLSFIVADCSRTYQNEVFC